MHFDAKLRCKQSHQRTDQAICKRDLRLSRLEWVICLLLVLLEL